jgi:hypothetical protein
MCSFSEIRLSKAYLELIQKLFDKSVPSTIILSLPKMVRQAHHDLSTIILSLPKGDRLTIISPQSS